MKLRNHHTEHKNVHQKTECDLQPGKHMRPRVDGHDAAPTHREHVCCGESEALLPARGNDIKVLFNCFQLFDTKKQDYLLADDIDEVMRFAITAILIKQSLHFNFIFRAMGFRPTAEELAELIEEIDEDGSGAIEFPEFAQLCAKFLVEDPDPETMRAELKQAFRLFDKQGTVSCNIQEKKWLD